MKQKIITFPVIHEDFYKMADPWMKDLLKEQEEVQYVYTLYSHKPIGRLYGTDPNGILYIGKGGMSPNQSRLGQLINSLNDTGNDHDCGNRYAGSPVMYRIYPLRNCSLQVELSEQYTDRETYLLSLYRLEFGELPPLNRIGGAS